MTLYLNKFKIDEEIPIEKVFRLYFYFRAKLYVLELTHPKQTFLGFWEGREFPCMHSLCRWAMQYWLITHCTISAFDFSLLDLVTTLNFILVGITSFHIHACVHTHIKRSITTFYFPLFGWKEAQSPLDFKGMLFITVSVTKA